MPVRTKNQRIQTYKQGLEMLGIRYNKKAEDFFNCLLADGHTEKSICFSIYKTYDKLAQFAGDNRFWSVFANEVRKWSWPTGDPRWVSYYERKKEIDAVKAKQAKENKRLEQERRISEVQKGKFPGFIYFIQGKLGGPIKIGYSTDVSERLKSLQTGHPDILVCLCLFPGNHDMENLIHKDLEKFRVRANGEWFSPSPYVLERMKLYQERAESLKNEKWCKRRKARK